MKGEIRVKRGTLPGGVEGWVKNLLSLCAVAAVVLAGRSVLADHYIVPTGSMEPSVEVGDRLLVNKAAYGVRVPFTEILLLELDGPKAGDVVVLNSPEDGETLLKRVAAVPGDVVSVRGGRVFLDGAPQPVRDTDSGQVETPRGVEHPVGLGVDGGPDFGPVRIPPRSYLVMGDNRGNSHDGRSFGLVRRPAILGRAAGVFYSDSTFTWRDL